jgi:hypothetical protein
MIYDLVLQYGSLGPFLSVVILLCLFLYFITSSDSGSLVDTIISSNGLEEPCIFQRVYWSLTEGAAASSLLFASNYMIDDQSASMKALQALSIAGGLPYTILVCFMCVALWKTLRFEAKEERFFHGFRSSALDIGITLYSGREGGEGPLQCRCSCLPTLDTAKFTKWAISCVFPLYLMSMILPKLDEVKQKEAQNRDPNATDKRSQIRSITLLVFAALLFYSGWCLIILDPVIAIEDGFMKRGEKNGTYNLIKVQYSSRYGHFHGTTNEYKNGERITYPDELTQKEKDRGMNMAVGERRGASHMQLAVFGWFFYLFFASIVTVIRISTRELFKISGSILEDFLASVFFFPSVLIQVSEVLDQGKKVPDDGKEPVAY